MRHIFLAAVCTLAVIVALLALPPLNEQDAILTAPSAGDALASRAEDLARETLTATAGAAPRLLVTPGAGDSAPEGELALADGTSADDGTADGVVDEAGASSSTSSVVAESSPLTAATDEDVSPTTETTTTAAPTTTTAAPTTTTTVAPTTTTTAAPTTTTTAASAPAPAHDSGGVVVSERGVVLPILASLGAGEGWRVSTPCGNEVTIDSGRHVPTVDFVLDAGHGGTETGAVGPNGVTEKELNVRIAEIVEWYLNEAGYSTLLTRTTDIRVPLRSRAEIANALQPDAFISIHHNGGATRRQDTPGTELFVDGGNPEAGRLGGILFEEMIDRLSDFEADWVGTVRNGVSTRFNSSGEDLYGIHRFTPGVVSVITEAGYLSNASEAELFADNDFQWAHGRAIAEGLIRWQTTSDPGSGFLPDFVDDSSSGTGGFTGCTDPEL